MEKLELLKSPDEQQRRLLEIPNIHTDPNMDPSYESEADDGGSDGKKQGPEQCLVDVEQFVIIIYV